MTLLLGLQAPALLATLEDMAEAPCAVSPGGQGRAGLLSVPVGAANSARHQASNHGLVPHVRTAYDCRRPRQQPARVEGASSGQASGLSQGRGLPGGLGCTRSSPGMACWSPAGRQRPAAGAGSSFGPCHLKGDKRGSSGPPRSPS